ncbi:MAG: branched-chain amino acid transport system II carrier protein [Selenomonadaceae bacterium]|nr:branched-chain amino acid transport system II carrier protein [Selenomonadaceae bacterium]
MHNLSKIELLSVGFMVFSIFFGAGNLIFPPFLAQNAGTSFPIAMAGFLATGIGLPLLGLIATAKHGGRYTQLIDERVHPVFRAISFGLLYLTIGPLFAVPRTGAVSFEIGIKPFLAVGSASTGELIYTAVFFLVTYWLAANPSMIVDRVGKVLSPLLLLFLCVLFARTYYEPIGRILEPVEEYAVSPFASGFINGYLTMDMLAALPFATLAITAIRQKGLTENADICRACVKACIIAVVLMGMVYVSLAYLGATCPSVLGYSANGGIILSSATYVFFGDTGKIVLAFIIGFACLTTSIGVSSAFASYYQYVFDGRVAYKTLLKLAVFFSFLASNVGLTELIRISVPFLVALYPIFIVLVLVSLFDRQLGCSRSVYRWSIGMTLPFSILDGLQAADIKLAGLQELLTQYLPLYAVNLGWLLPALLGVAIGYVLARR